MATSQWQKQGDHWANPVRSKEIRKQAYGMMKFRQFTKKENRYGAHKGATIDWTRLAKVSDAGGKIPENSPVPVTSIAEDTGTCLVEEYGNAAEWTSIFETFAELEIRGNYSERLQMDMAATLDKAIYDAFCECLIKYTPTGTGTTEDPNTGTISVDGTYTTAATRHFGMFDVYEIHEYLEQVLKAQPFDQEGNFVMLINGSTARVLREDPDYIKILQYAEPKRLLRGEVGMIDGMRFVKETQTLPRYMDDKTYKGSGFAFGRDPVIEALAMSPELRGETQDFERLKRLAWLGLFGFNLNWDDDSADEGKARVVHVISKPDET